MISTVLTTRYLNSSHTTEYLRDTLLTIASEWNISNKIVGVVTDNAANIMKAIGSQGCKWRHIPCFAHSLSLVVKGAIESSREISDILTRCRNIITFLHSSHLATAKLNQFT